MKDEEAAGISWWWNARGFELLLLTLACVGAVFGRVPLVALQESMRLDLGWTDNQIAILQGTGPGLAMALASISVGAWVDRHSRKRIILIFTLFNIFAGLVTALASNYALMLAARIIPGITGPGVIIAVLSLIADDFAPAERGRATMVMTIGQVMGVTAVATLGGWLLTVVGGGDDAWRRAMLWLVAPLVPILLILSVLKEPPRQGTERRGSVIDREGFQMLWWHRGVFGAILAGAGIVGIADGASSIWIVPLLTRKFAMPPDQIGALFGAVMLISGLAGPILGGTLADYCQRRGGPRVTVSWLAALVALSTPAGLFALAPTASWMSIGMVVFFTVGAAVNVVVGTLVTIVMPGRIRGLSISVMITFMVVCGAGIAPLLTSLLSGALGGESMIGLAIVVLSIIGSLLGAGVFWLGRRHFPTEENTQDPEPIRALLKAEDR